MAPYDTTSCGRRLIPLIIDQLALERPCETWISVPKSRDIKDGFRNVSYWALANAVNRLSWWIESRLGRSTNFETLAYIGANDARYFIILAAAMKTGYKAFFSSPRNSLVGHLSLMEATQCDILLHDTSRSYTGISDKGSMRSHAIPELEELWNDEPVPHYPFNRSYEDAMDDPCMVLHTSGTTGIPKPVVITNNALATVDALWLIPSLDGRECSIRTMTTNQRLYVAMPFFHMAGLSMVLFLSLCSDTVAVFGPEDRPVSVPLVEDVIASANVSGALLPPSILEEMSRSEGTLKKLATLSMVYYGGGPISTMAGNAISQKTHLYNQIGSTESIVYATHDTDPEDWSYFCFSPHNGFVFQETSEKGIYEQHVVRDPSKTIHQGAFKTFPSLETFPTKDLYSKHPKKPNHWRFQGRSDDVIVFSNGEKWNPTSAEAHIRTHPYVDTALIVGNHRLQPAVIIELKKSSVSRKDANSVIDGIWPTVAEANAESPGLGQIAKSLVILSKHEKPFERTGKGTMNRSATLQLYKEDIDNLYAEVERQSLTCNGWIDIRSTIAVQKFVQHVFADMTGNRQLDPSTDVFAAGADSLQVLNAVRKIRSRILLSSSNVHPSTITQSMVYSFPTVTKTTAFLCSLATSDSVGLAMYEETHLSKVEAMLDKYTEKLPKTGRLRTRCMTEPFTVILTGSTGSLGSYLLDTLITQARVSKIYCLNRSADARSKQAKSNQARGLLTDWSLKNVEFVHADLSLPLFGLDESIYSQMLQSVNYIIHNQWQVNFNLSLSSFEPHIHGVRNLVEFSTRCAQRAPIFFLSSISTVQNWVHAGEKVPEGSLPDLTLAVDGYGQSKAVAALLLERANRTLGVSGAVCRLGQIAGPVERRKGWWNRHEWLPTVIAASRRLGLLPSDLAALGTIDWIPVDLTAKILIELAFADSDENGGENDALDYPLHTAAGMRTFHVVNTKVCHWQDLLPAVRDHLGGAVRVVPFRDWVAALDREACDGADDINPGAKLVDFFRGLLRSMDAGREYTRLDTRMTERHTKTLRELGPVTEEWMRIWLKQWDF